MDRKLLSLALTVSRHSEGHYYWAILESFDHSSEFSTLLEAASSFPTYIRALEAGYAVLTGIAGDLNTGPLADSTNEGEDSSWTQASETVTCIADPPFPPSARRRRGR